MIRAARMLLATLLAGVPALAAAAPAMEFANAWVRATPPGQSVAAAYGILRNRSNVADRLLAATSPQAASVEAHVTELVNGVYQMRDSDLRVPAGAQTTLEPEGSHLMVMGLKGPLRPGDRLTVILRFAKAGLVRVDIPVRPASATGP